MDGRMHRRTAAWACKHVQDPVWRKYITEVSEAGTYPDAYIFGEAAPDKTKWDKWWRELTLIEHENRMMTIHRVYDTLRLRETYPEVVRMLVRLSLRAFREGNEELAVKAGGVLTHLVGDTIQPAHTTDNQLVTWMWPQARYNTRFMTHPFMELTICEIDESIPYSPVTLGMNDDSFIWRLCERLEKGKMDQRGEIPILMDANFAHDTTAATASAERTALVAAQIDADIFNTLSVLSGRIPGKVEEQVDMTELIWTDCDVDNMFNYMPMVNMMPSSSFEHGTLLDIGEGPTRGISILPMMAQSYMGIRKAEVTYNVRKCGYKYFSCRLGVQRFASKADVPYTARTNETSVRFELRLDGKTVWTSKELTDQDPAVPVCIALDDAESLTIYVRDTRGPNALTRFVYPVIALPMLSGSASENIG